MGNQLVVASGSQSGVGDLPDISDLPLTGFSPKQLGGGRLLKSLQCSHEDGGSIVVKLYLKKDEKESLKPYDELVRVVNERLSARPCPNICGYSGTLETERAGYLVRPFYYCSLSDRVSTVPFLTSGEKKWLAFQLLCALEQCRAAGVSHGDIKPANVLVSTWHWLVLADLAPFKPTYLPEDNPADFSFFFVTDSDRRTCYLAPERFLDSGARMSSLAPRPPTPAMDIFSAGCVIAELFLDGEPLFDLSTLLAYRRDEFDLQAALSKIDDPPVRSLVAHMLQRDPSDRLTAAQYIKQWTPSVFSPYMSALHTDLFSRFVGLDSDTRIAAMDSMYPHLVASLTAASSFEAPFPPKGLIPISSSLSDFFSSSPTSPSSSSSALSSPPPFGSSPSPSPSEPPSSASASVYASKHDAFSSLGMSLCAVVVCMSLRSCAGWGSKSLGLDLLRRMSSSSHAISSLIFSKEDEDESMQAEKEEEKKKSLKAEDKVSIPVMDDETMMQSVLPYVVALLSDPSPAIRSDAIWTLAVLVSHVRAYRPSDSHLFVEYVLPALAPLCHDASESVRVSLALHIPAIALAAKRFLETSHAIRHSALYSPSPAASVVAAAAAAGGGAGNNNNDVSIPYDADMTVLQEQIEGLIRDLSVGNSTQAKRALMQGLIVSSSSSSEGGGICSFFGRRGTTDFLLPIMSTFLNSRDWELRRAFFAHVVAVAAFVGSTPLENFILPLMLHAFNDAEEFVMEAALNAVVSLTELGLFKRSALLEIASKVAPMLFHPNTWIRSDAISFFAGVCKRLSLAEVACHIHPLLTPFLNYPILDITASTLMQALKTPVSRPAFDRALNSSASASASAANAASSASAPLSSSVPSASSPLSSSFVPVSSSSIDGSQSLNGLPPWMMNAESSSSSAGGSDMSSSSSSSMSAPMPASASVGAAPNAANSASPSSSSSLSMFLDYPAVEDDSEKIELIRGYLETTRRAIMAKRLVWDLEDSSSSSSSSSSANPSSSAPADFLQVSKTLPLWGAEAPAPGRSAASNADIGSYSSPAVDAPIQSGRDRGMSVRTGPGNNGAVVGAIGGAVVMAGGGGNNGNGNNMDMDAGASQISAPTPMMPAAAAGGANNNMADGSNAAVAGGGIPSSPAAAFRPVGHFLAQAKEHKGAITEACPLDPVGVFATAGFDGCVRLWDVRQLDRDSALCSVMTVSMRSAAGAPAFIVPSASSAAAVAASNIGSPISPMAPPSAHDPSNVCRVLTVCQAPPGTGPSAFVAGTDKGRVHIVAVESGSSGVRDIMSLNMEGNAAVSVVRTVNPPIGSPLILCGTRQGAISAIDPRVKPSTISNSFSARLERNLGGITAMCSEDLLGTSSNVVVCGTQRGYLVLLDLRFQIPVNTSRHPACVPIRRICPAPSLASAAGQPSPSPSVFMSVGGTPSIFRWSLENPRITAILRPQGAGSGNGLSAFAASQPQGAHDEFGALEMMLGDTVGTKALLPTARGFSLMTGGSDRCIRLWDLKNPSQSYMISSSSSNSALEVPAPPNYRLQTSSDGIAVVVEEAAPLSASAASALGGLVASGGSLSGSSSGMAASASSLRAGRKVSSGLAVSTAHADTITDLAIVPTPTPLLLSSSRDGCVTLWR